DVHGRATLRKGDDARSRVQCRPPAGGLAPSQSAANIRGSLSIQDDTRARAAGAVRPATKEATPRMCGIVGYVGFRAARPLLLAGLEKLEYRGYDSAGI